MQDDDRFYPVRQSKRRQTDAEARQRQVRRVLASGKPASGHAPGGGRHSGGRQPAAVTLPKLSIMDDETP